MTKQSNGMRYAAKKIRTMLNSDAPIEIDPKQAGDHAELLTSLADVHREANCAGTNNAWSVLVLQFPDLAQFVANYRNRLHHVTDLSELPPREVIHGIFGRGDIAMMYGPAGVGKTFVMLSIALALGDRFHVVYLAGEGLPGYTERIEAFYKRYPQYSKADSKFYLYERAVNMLDPGAVSDFIDEIKEDEVKPDIIILDTLHKCMLNGDENSARDAGLYISGVEALKEEFGAAIISLHHPSKRGDEERGSNAFRSDFDVMIKLSEKDDVIMLECNKHKYQKEPDPIYFTLELVPLDNGATNCVAVPSTSSRNQFADQLNIKKWVILETLSLSINEASGMTVNEIAEASGLDKKSIYNNISPLFDAGYVEKSGKRNAVYTITEDGVALLTEREEEIAQSVDVSDPLSLIPGNAGE